MSERVKRAFVAATVVLGAAAAIVASEGIARAQSVGSELVEGQALYPGQWLTSPNGEYRLALQGDGNLVFSNDAVTPHVAVWTTRTDGYAPRYALLQNDGNFVLSNTAAHAIWTSQTNGWAGVVVSAGNDGAVYIDGSYPYWATGTNNVGTLSPPSPHPPAHASSFTQGGALRTGEYLQSPSGEFVLAMQGDGNLVVYQNNRAVWASNTSNRMVWGASIIDVPVPHSFVERRGTLVLTDYEGNIFWSSGADFAPVVAAHGWSASSGRLQIQDDGNLVLYANVEERYTQPAPIIH